MNTTIFLRARASLAGLHPQQLQLLRYCVVLFRPVAAPAPLDFACGTGIGGAWFVGLLPFVASHICKIEQ
jgi:hypothetical protein